MKNLSVYSSNIKRVKIIGVPISAVNMEIVLECIQNDLEDIRKKGNYICVSNVHTTVMAHDNPNYYEVQKNSYLTVPDGMPLVLEGKKICPEMNRVTGLDLMKRIFEISKEKHYKHYFYGNTNDNLNVFIAKLKENYPWIDIAGYCPSVFRDLSDDEKSELVKIINKSDADFVWVSMGAPIQEFFCSEMKGKIHALMVGTGGVFNIMAGIIPDAPHWMKIRCLEWLYRLIKEPKRLYKRYLTTNVKYVWYLIKEGSSF